MPLRRVVRTLAMLGTVTALTLSAAGAAVCAAIPASNLVTTSPAMVVKPKPKPVPLPVARSWVGGKKLISARVVTDLPAGVPAPPAQPATSWLVADLDTRQVLAGFRVHVPLAPASTLKIFTALALAHRLNPAALYTGRDDDAAVDGTKVGIVPGSTYTVNDLLHGMLMSSGNDCANALGNAVGGKATAIGLIQDQARQLGAFDTVVHTTNGLDAPGQVSSAYDLALAGSAALADPQLTKVMQTKIYRFPAAGRTLSPKRARYQIQSHDKLLTNYRGATGVKNGYTVAAEGSFVGTATRNGHSYIAVVMRAEGNTWKQAATLLDWAFANGQRAIPVGTLVRPGELTAMTGPGIPAVQAGPTAAAGTSSDQGDQGLGTGGDLRAALPTSHASLSRTSALSGQLGRIGLGAAVLALLLAAGVGSRKALRTREPAVGRHRT